MVSDDLKSFYSKMKEHIEEEKNGLQHSVSHGLVDTATYSYEYWVGMVLAYEEALSELNRLYRRFEGDLFEGEDE